MPEVWAIKNKFYETLSLLKQIKLLIFSFFPVPKIFTQQYTVSFSGKYK